MTNLLAVAWELTDAERKLIAEAIRRYDGEKIDYSVRRIGFLSGERVVAALWLYGTNAAIDLALKLRIG